MFAVVGSTGQVGGAVVRALRTRGAQVRGLLRDEAKADEIEALGAEPFVASVEDGSRLEMAFERAEGVFVMTPPLYKSPDPRAEHRLALAALAHALQASHVPQVVFLSSVGAQHDSGTGPILKLHDMEEELFPLPFSAASLRAAYFMENFLLPHAKQTGKLPVVLEPFDRPFSMVATADIGETAARLLTDGWNGKRILELEGPRQYSMADAAHTLTGILGRPVEPELVAPGARQAMYESFGMTPLAAEAMVEMADGLNSGLIDFAGGAGAEYVQGTTTLEAVLGGK